MREWGRGDTARLLRAPSALDDKYSRGVVGLRTGSPEYPGAAVLGVEAAWRAGAGFVRFSGPPEVGALVLARRPETVVGSATSGRVGAWVIGSGTDAATRSVAEERHLRDLLAGAVPVVADAGALDLVPDAAASVIATPHAGEYARLRGIVGLAAPGQDRVAALRETAEALGQTVLLKGAETLVAASDGTVFIVPAQTHWLAVAGTGDVLAGVIGTLLAANPQATPAEAGAAAAWLHGRAAARAAGARQGSPGRPIVAMDVTEALPDAIAEVLSR